MRMTRTGQAVMAIAVLVLGAGCGDGSDANTPDVAASETPATKVSVETTCNLLFDGKAAPLENLVDFAVTKETTTEKVDAATEDLAEMRDITDRAPEELAANLKVLGDELQKLIDNATKPSEQWDTTAFRAAGLEVTNVCDEFE
jgi:hypothetical protein